MANLIPPNLDFQQFRLLVEVYKSNFRAYKSYAPQQVYPNRMVLFQGCDSDEGANYIDDPSWGWRKLSYEPVDVFTVPGNHYTMITQPHVRSLAERLRIYLNEAE